MMPAPTTSYHLRISQSQSYPVNITFLSWHRKSVIVGNCILTTVFSLRNSCGEPWIYSSCDMLPSYSLVELTSHDLRPHLVYTDPVLDIPPDLLLCWEPGKGNCLIVRGCLQTPAEDLSFSRVWWYKQPFRVNCNIHTFLKSAPCTSEKLFIAIQNFRCVVTKFSRRIQTN